jgi:hypothetical protein
MEIRVRVDDDFMKELLESLQLRNSTEVAREALTLLNWIVGETKNNRIILFKGRRYGYSPPDNPGADEYKEGGPKWAVID